MQPANRQRTVFAGIVVIGLLAIFCSILLTIVIIYITTSRLTSVNVEETAEPLTQFDNPLTAMSQSEIDPALAILSLAGVPEEAVIVEALEKSRPETALATLSFFPLFEDRVNAGHYLALGQAFAENNQLDKATLGYQMAGKIAIISPTMPDNIRADILLLASKGLAPLEQNELTKFYADQAFTIALHSANLQAIQRRAIFERLHLIYLDLDEAQLARNSLDFSTNPPLTRPAGDNRPLLPTWERGSLPTSAQALETERWIRAQQLAALLVEKNDNIPAEVYEALQNALLAEDEQKLTQLEEEYANTSQLTVKLSNLATQIEWLSIKYRVANQGYGLSLVPAWEGDVTQIEADLQERYRRLFNLYDEMIIALPQIEQIDQATEEMVRREILLGELGHYPNYIDTIRQSQLLELSQKLQANQPERNLFLSLETVLGEEIYTLKARN